MSRGLAVQRAAAALLILHQRHGIGGCLCGWAVLGASHTDHLAKVLADAGLLAHNDRSTDA